MTSELALETQKLESDLRQRWEKLIRSLNQYNTSPTNASTLLQLLSDFDEALDIYSKKKREENKNNIISTLSTQVATLPNAQLLPKLEALSLAVTQFEPRDTANPEMTNALKKKRDQLKALLALLIGNNTRSTTIVLSNIEKQSVNMYFKTQESHYRKSVASCVQQLEDYLYAKKALTSCPDKYFSKTEKEQKRESILKLDTFFAHYLNILWAADNTPLVAEILDKDPALAKRLYQCQKEYLENLQPKPAENLERGVTHAYRSQDAYNIRMAKFEASKLIQQKHKHCLFQSQSNRSVFKTAEAKVSMAKELSEVHQALEEIKSRYEPRTQIFSLFEKIAGLFQKAVKREQTKTHQIAETIQNKYTRSQEMRSMRPR